MEPKDYSFAQFRQPDGTFELPNNTTHHSAESVICDALGFCGCGSPSDALVFVRDAIKLLVLDLAEIRDSMPEPWDSKLWDARYKEWHSRVEKLFPTAGAEYFFLYWLHDRDLIEHGGNVAGGWLTEGGQMLYQDLLVFGEELKQETELI